MRQTISAIAFAIAVLFVASLAIAQSEDPKDRARAHFDLGLEHFDRGEFSAALAEFLIAREIFPSRGATKNAAICLRKEGRFDEALDMFESLVKEFPDLSETDKALVDKEIGELRLSIGTITIQTSDSGASVIIDARPRGKTPIDGPLRVGAGSHVLRVVKDGYLPFEQRFDIAGKQALVFNPKLSAMTRSGRLSVTEKGGETLSVYIDGVLSGATPWSGTVPPGTHMVVLRGAGVRGTQPVSAPVRFDDTTNLTLEAVDLGAEIRIDPVPASALIALDGVTLGHGVWEGRLIAGPHTIEVTEEGFLVAKKSVTLGKERELVRIELERDPTSTAFKKKDPPHFYTALELGPAFGSLGGDIASECTGACSQSELALVGVLRGGYQLTGGFGFGVDLGGFYASRSIGSHPTSLVAVGGVKNDGTASDSTRLSAMMAGASMTFRRGEAVVIGGRIGFGILAGVTSHERDGTFVGTAGTSYPSSAGTPAKPLHDAFGTSALYGWASFRIGYAFSRHFSVDLGAELIVMGMLAVPRWKSSQAPNVISPDNGLASIAGGTSVTQTVLVYGSPTLGLRYDF